MAGPKRTPNLSAADILKMIDGQPDRATFNTALRAGVDLAKSKGVDSSTFKTPAELFAWVRANEMGVSKADVAGGAPQGPATPPKTEKPASVEDIPVEEDAEGVLNQGEGEKPKQRRGGGRTSASQENKDIYAFLITSGMDKKVVDKMSPKERKAARDRIVIEARDRKTGTASKADTNVGKDSSEDPPATQTELADPPKEPIKAGNKRRPARGGNAAQEQAADRIAPPQKNKAKAASETLPEDDGPDDDLVPVGESDKPKLGDRFRDSFRGKRAADWGEWWDNKTMGLPDKIPLPGGGEVNTPYTLRAAKEGGQYVAQNALSPSTWLGGLMAYNLGGPMVRAARRTLSGLLGSGGPEQQQQQQQPQVPSQMAPPTANPNDYWQQYNSRQQQPRPPAPQPPTNQSSSSNWWDDEVGREIMSIQAGQTTRSEDTIRKFRGIA